MEIYSSMKILDDLDFKSWMDWKLNMELVFGLMDLDFALREDEPEKPTVTSSSSAIAQYEKWERSNRLSLLMMRKKMHDGLYALVPVTDYGNNAKQFFAALEELFLKIEKAKHFEKKTKLLRIYGGEGIEYEGEGSLTNQILRLSSFGYRLRTAGVSVSDELIVEGVIGALPTEKFTNLQINYDLSKEKWGMVDLICKCERAESVHRMIMMNRDDSASCDREWIGNGQPEEKMKGKRCFSCGRTGHLKKDCKRISSR
ncbi:hypothetical protein JCGZ_07579 [Jatropha curcas]|uniref:CCHC-type domain-containing protein n=1 Tax=Jatropha curcas TaxID=180498 RepID=A0A067KG62_JATCU|nr:uncharacterized protein LOC105638061 [Jatropha curcas]KDP34008.1 hypothetical protein JCGZ_07579 [Jatropha curcas]